MKTLRYFLLGLMLVTLISACSQTPAKNKQVIIMRSIPGNAAINLLTESKEILTKRLELMGVRDVQITQNNATSELVIAVGDTTSYYTLAKSLLIQGNACFKVDTSVLVLNKENLKEVRSDFSHADFPTLFIIFKESMWKTLENMTDRNVNKPLAFIIDDKVYSAPRIMEKITHGKISMTGNGFSKAEIRKLVAIISSGTVPLKFEIVSVN